MLAFPNLHILVLLGRALQHPPHDIVPALIDGRAGLQFRLCPLSPRLPQYGGFLGEDAMNSSKFNWFADLQAHPDLAEQIGHYTAEFSLFEHGLWQIYGIVLGTDGVGAMTLLGSIQSFSLKLQAVERLFDLKMSSDPMANEFRSVFAGAKKINAFRNILAHGLYVSDEAKTEIWIISYLADPGRKQKPETELTPQRMADELMILRAVRRSTLPILKAKRPAALRP